MGLGFYGPGTPSGLDVEEGETPLRYSGLGSKPP